VKAVEGGNAVHLYKRFLGLSLLIKKEKGGLSRSSMA
jgi:hypothetical protein